MMNGDQSNWFDPSIVPKKMSMACLWQPPAALLSAAWDFQKGRGRIHQYTGIELTAAWQNLKLYWWLETLVVSIMVHYKFIKFQTTTSLSFQGRYHFYNIHPGKMNGWNTKMEVWFLFNWVMLRVPAVHFLLQAGQQGRTSWLLKQLQRK